MQQLPLSAPANHPILSCNLQSGTPKQKRRRILQLNTNLECPCPCARPLNPPSMANAIWNYKINKARYLNASNAVYTIYFYELEVIFIDNWRVVTTRPTNHFYQESHQQNQYHVYFGPMTIEKWALPILKKAGFTPKKIHPIACSAVECACSESCFYNFGFQPETNVPP